MPSLVVPFRGAKGKSRLGPLPETARATLAYAMLEDVVRVCASVGPTFLVSPDGANTFGATAVRDPGNGQGAAVRAGLEAAALAGGAGPFLVVNADLPCVTSRDLFTLAGAVPEHGLVVAAAADGTTNALGLASPELFIPVYGPGSAARFAAVSSSSRTVAAPNLVDDVDTIADLERLGERLGPCTRSILASLQVGAVA
jgi:2-phospho-L-lactate guanylyltransferase